MVQVGGVAGQTIFGATLTACYATGNVTIEIDRTQDISGGGLVGFNDGISLLSCLLYTSIVGHCRKRLVDFLELE